MCVYQLYVKLIGDFIVKPIQVTVYNIDYNIDYIIDYDLARIEC